MSRDEILQKVRLEVGDLLGVASDEIVSESKYVEDLGADSLDLVELVLAMEEEFELEITDEAAEKLKTVGETVEFIVNYKRP